MRQILTRHRKPLLILMVTMVLTPIVILLVLLRGPAELEAPAATPIFTDRHGTFLSEAEDERLGYWDVDLEQAERVAAALIAIEDRRFQQHGGVDIWAIMRALTHNIRGGSRQGASTLAMQVARLQAESPRGYRQKLVEAATAWRLTRNHGREAVLAHYLKIAPMGNRIHGVAYAARRYFHKPIEDLSWAEAALLAALPKAPGRMNLYTGKGLNAARERASRVLKLLYQNGELNETGYAQALDQLNHLEQPSKGLRPDESMHAILRLHRQEKQTTYTGPLRTTLDLKLQQRIATQARATIRDLRVRGAGNLSVMLVSRMDGDVLAYLGSARYDDQQNAGSIDYATTPRSAGSTLKPFIYAQGLEDGHFEPGSILDDLPLHISHEGGHYTATNYDDGYLGPMLYRRALANSRNIPALTVLRQTGLDRTYERLRQLGLGSAEVEAAHYGLGLAIGGMYVTLDQLVNAYGTLANDGHEWHARWLLDKPGGPTSQNIYPVDVARQITLFISDPVARLPSFPSMNAPFPMAIKTGTSQAWRDGWALAYTHEYILGIWIGRPDHQSMKQVGGQSAAALAKEILTALHPLEAQGVNVVPFPEPDEHVTVALCPLSGQPATPRCSEVAYESYPKGAEPHGENTVHRRYAMDETTGERATILTPPEHLTFRDEIVLPPRYAAWGIARGYTSPIPTGQEAAETNLSIRGPVQWGRYRMDPDLPRRYQTLSLRASVTPAVPEVIWYVNGKPYQRAKYPYTVRWPLEEGTHQFQVRFPNAAVASNPVTIQVSN